MTLCNVKNFSSTLVQHGVQLTRTQTRTLQVNIGKLCNQACRHCHVEAGPRRREVMSIDVINRVLSLLSESSIEIVDITGGAPELNPYFRYLVTECRRLGRQVINRCNLTVLFEKGQEDTAEFMSEQKVHIVASLPCYSKNNVDTQRGNGVFDQSIRALQKLNELGYGQVGSGLCLDLVYNPVGANLPPAQTKLEAQYRVELEELFGIVFNNLYTITNMPIKRFYYDLKRSGKIDQYMDLLVMNFNAQAALNVMCRNLISVSWDGGIYDCDFNQMLEMPAGGSLFTVFDIQNFAELESRPIAVADHCFGCTAGAGSSCTGAVV